MPSIEPQSPPHLEKRKRTPDDNGDDDSPPLKVTRPSNEDEIALDDSNSDDGFGPSAAQATRAPAQGPAKPAIGPSLPPQQAARPEQGPKRAIGPSLPPKSNNDDEIQLDDSSESEAGPKPSAPKRTYGPAPPPAPLDERPPTAADSSDDDDDDGYGPALPSASGSRPGEGCAPDTNPQSHASETNGAPRRDDWMLAPPTQSGYRVNDPTQIKQRKFASGRSARGAEGQTGVSSIWTETPEEKAQRIADRVLGRNDGSGAPIIPTTAGPGSSTTAPGRDEDAERVRMYTEQTRGNSLYEEHQRRKKEGSRQDRTGQGKGKEEEDDDPSKRVFDREKDMGLGGRISGSQRRELLNRASTFGNRFEKGKYL